MKRRLIICSSLITIILSCFSFPIFAEETVQDSSNLHSLSDGVFLDSYFYDNYDLLPYIDSSFDQYIDTGVVPSSTIGISLKFSDIKVRNSNPQYLFGVFDDNGNYGTYVVTEENNIVLYIKGTISSNPIIMDPYIMHDVSIMGNNGYFDGSHVLTRQSTYQMINNCYVFGRNVSNTADYRASFKLYSLKIMDLAANDGEGAYLKYFYPAKAKASGIIGLYDAVNKTFLTSGSSVPFANPTDEYVESFQISSFLTASLTWIGQIFTAIIDMPIIIIFMAIGLAGAMFRWGRRIVHF